MSYENEDCFTEIGVNGEELIFRKFAHTDDYVLINEGFSRISYSNYDKTKSYAIEGGCNEPLDTKYIIDINENRIMFVQPRHSSEYYLSMKGYRRIPYSSYDPKKDYRIESVSISFRIECPCGNVKYIKPRYIRFYDGFVSGKNKHFTPAGYCKVKCSKCGKVYTTCDPDVEKLEKDRIIIKAVQNDEIDEMKKTDRIISKSHPKADSKKPVTRNKKSCINDGPKGVF